MNETLWNALWKIVCENTMLFRSRAVGELHSIGRRIHGAKPWLDEEGWEWDALTSWALEVSKKVGRLPKEVEEIVLQGPTTGNTQKYLAMWSPETEAKPAEKKEEQRCYRWAVRVSNLNAGKKAKRKNKERTFPYPKHSHLEDMDVGLALVYVDEAGHEIRHETHNMTTAEARILASALNEMADNSARSLL